MQPTKWPDNERSSVKEMAYFSTSGRNMLHGSRIFRLERGFPFIRAGQAVFATPQWKALTLYTPTNVTSQLPSTAITSGSISYPFKTR